MSQFKVEVIADSSGRWSGNERVFATQEAAETYAADLARRWTLVREWRVVETEESGADARRQNDSPSSSCDSGFTVTLGPIARVFRTLCTTAPSAYDAGTSITLMRGAAGSIEVLLRRDQLLAVNKQVPARVVLVEANLFEWHRARYASGLYASAEPDPTWFGSPEIAAELLRRWERGAPVNL
jgi:hypothetical protein